jgi:hypothetical protein
MKFVKFPMAMLLIAAVSGSAFAQTPSPAQQTLIEITHLENQKQAQTDAIDVIRGELHKARTKRNVMFFVLPVSIVVTAGLALDTFANMMSDVPNIKGTNALGLGTLGMATVDAGEAVYLYIKVKDVAKADKKLEEASARLRATQKALEVAREKLETELESGQGGH